VTAMNRDLYIRSLLLNKNDSDNGNVYPFNLPVIRQLERLDFTKKVTFFVGENGTGKSTLLEAIAVAYGFNAEGGSKNFNFSTRSTHSSLHEHIALSKGVKQPKDGFFLRAESFYNVATEVDELGEGLLKSYGGASLHGQSHGESFLSLMLNRFWGNGLYLLDEPESALSPARQLSMLAILNDLVKKDSQFIIATHSPILLAYPDALIYLFSEDKIEPVKYEQTENYLLTKQFLNHTDRMLKELLD